MKMNRNKMIPLVFVVMFILGLYATAFCGGGGEGSACDNPPAPTRGQFLYGTFTAARDNSTCVGIDPVLCGHNNVHVVLRHKLNEVHLFSFSTATGGKSLCDYEASNPDPNNPGLKEIFASKPCGENYGEPFGFPLANYFPVIHEIQILNKDFCGSSDEMIFGLITIRLVPIKIK
jgi:hypothetical protein